jgi:hypothetical protein
MGPGSFRSQPPRLQLKHFIALSDVIQKQSSSKQVGTTQLCLGK